MKLPCLKLAAAVLVAGLASLAAGAVHGDELDQSIKIVTRLDQRAHIMALEFNEAPGEAADLADRRVIDAQGLLGLGHTDQAMTLLLGVVIRWPRSLAARDATFLLGDALFSLGDLFSARRSYELAVLRFTGTRREQQAVVRLIEIALRTRDLGHVDQYLALLATVPGAALDPAVAYVKAKLFYFRDDLDEATRVFGSIAPASPYAWRARYFIATISVKRGDLDRASAGYQALLLSAAPDDEARDIQDLARLALGRISYQQGDASRATLYYQSIPSGSKALPDGLYELGWTYVRAKDFAQALTTFARLLQLQPDGPQAPELVLLTANLQLRQGNFALAKDAFSRARDGLAPTYQHLSAVIEKSQAEPLFLDGLTSRSLDEMDLAAFVPAEARKWVRADPEVDRLLTLVTDVVAAQRGVTEVTNTITWIQDVLANADRVMMFPDLGRVRRGSREVLMALVEIRARFLGRARGLEQPWLSQSEALLLDHAAVERTIIERQLGARPAAEAPPDEAPRRHLEAIASATPSSQDQPVPGAQGVPEASPDPTGRLHAAVLHLAGPHAPAQSGLADAQRAVDAVVVSSGQREQAAVKRLKQIVDREGQIQQQALARVDRRRHGEIDRNLDVVARADAAVSQLLDLDLRVSAEADVRVAALLILVGDRRRDVVASSDDLATVVGQTRTLSGSLARLMYTRVADRLYDLIVRADVGLIDVTWAVKDRSSASVQTLVAKKNQELNAAHDQMTGAEGALSRRFEREAKWAKRAIPVGAPEEH